MYTSNIYTYIMLCYVYWYVVEATFQKNILTKLYNHRSYENIWLKNEYKLLKKIS